jgi:hypothetical protein
MKYFALSVPGCRVCQGGKVIKKQSVPWSKVLRSKVSWEANCYREQTVLKANCSKEQNLFRSKMFWGVKCVEKQSEFGSKVLQGANCVESTPFENAKRWLGKIHSKFCF